MRFSDLLRSSLGNLWQRKFRTSLTVTGVVVGTMAVVVMVSLGVGMSQAQMESLERYANLRQITVYGMPGGQVGGGPMATRPGQLVEPGTVMDENAITELAAMPGVSDVWGVYQVQAEITVDGTTIQVQLTGVPHEMLKQLDVEYASGGEPEPGAPLALIVGDKVGQMYSYNPTTGEPLEPLDFSNGASFVTFSNQPGEMGAPPGGGQGAGEQGTGEQGETTTQTPPKKFLVPTAGVLSGEENEWGRHSTSIYVDRDALIQTLEKAFPGKALPGQTAGATGAPRGPFVYSQILLNTVDVAAAKELTTSLQQEAYQISSDIEWMQSAQQSAALIQAVLGGIGFISLLVAAIGIANTMLMSVYERTREIGIMKVLGAALNDIRRLFLIESASLGFFGGLVGLLLSLAISAVINSVVAGMGASAGLGADTAISVIPAWLMLGAVGFATAIGTVAGIVPAQRAMRLSALAAIRTQ